MFKTPILSGICTLVCLLPVSAQSLLPHQRAANDALQLRLSKEGNDCLDVRNNNGDTFCITEVATQTDKDFSTFYENLKAILDQPNQKNLEDAQTKWVVYRDATCQAIDEFFRQGTARVGMVARCKIHVIRSRMKDLDAIYNLPLHH
jgi:uncharacterized protein YecT (DUF1311 family)